MINLIPPHRERWVRSARPTLLAVIIAASEEVKVPKTLGKIFGLSGYEIALAILIGILTAGIAVPGLVAKAAAKIAKYSPKAADVFKGLTKTIQGIVGNMRKATKRVSPQVRSAASKVEGFLGKDMVIKRADEKGFVALSKDGTRRFRLDLKGHGDAPHGHIEIFDAKRQRWIDAGPEHRYYFKGQE